MNTVNVEESTGSINSTVPVDHIKEENKLLNAAGQSPFEACDSKQRKLYYSKDGGEDLTFRTGLKYSFDIFGYCLVCSNMKNSPYLDFNKNQAKIPALNIDLGGYLGDQPLRFVVKSESKNQTICVIEFRE
jgi:hypothetical protein